MSNTYDKSLLLIKCLERFETESKKISNRNELVELFCEQIIPFLAEHPLISDLRKNWFLQRDQMKQKIQETEEKALEEVKETYSEVKKTLSASVDERITSKLELIEHLLSGKEERYGTPLYQIVYNECTRLFNTLVDIGHIDICKKYATLATHPVYVKIDPNQKDRWVHVLENGRMSKILSPKKLEIARKNNAESLLLIPPDYQLIDETYITEFLFAPSVHAANSAMKTVHWDQLTNPTIVWWYFESALWCWTTPELYFDQVLRPKNGDDNSMHYKTTCDKAAWREISTAKDPDMKMQDAPVIFTNHLFLTGLRTLTNAIHTYLSQDPSQRLIKTDIQSFTSFKLVLDINELWIHVRFENNVIEKFYIQKFHESDDPEGSALLKFVKSLINNPQAGEKKANLLYQWEAASKHINRLKLPPILKSAFFGKSRGSSFQFNGIQVQLSSNIENILKSLHERHKKYKACYHYT